MSLIKMLSFAKSLRGVRDDRSPFSVTQENLMPDFSRSGPHPVRPIAGEPTENGAGRLRSLLESPGSVGAGLEGRVQEKGVDMSEQRQAVLKPGAQPVAAGAGAAQGRPSRGRWVNNPFTSRPTLRADSKGQLSLEFVRVVRNDLSDADLELAPVRPTTPVPTPPPAGPSTPMAAVEPEPSRWSRFTARIFGSETTPG